MSATTLSLPNSPAASADGTAKASSLKRWLIIGALVLGSAVVSGFFAINEYSSASNALIAQGERTATRFEAVYRDAAETRLAALRLAADLVVANKELTGALARDDRPALMALALPLYNDVLKPRYGLTQFNFWTPPAKLYLRSIDPKEFGTDGSSARKSIVTAIERRVPVSGMEAAIGGRLGVRAITPIYDGTRLVGVVELGDDVFNLLQRAREVTSVEWSSGLDKKRSDEVERVADAKVDVPMGTDVFFRFSSDDAAKLMRSATFDPRSTKGQLVQQGGMTIYVKPFQIQNFAGVSTAVVASLFNLSEPFSAARQGAMIKGILLFLVLAVGGYFGFAQLGKIQAGFARVIFGERQKLEETTRALEAAKAKLKDIDTIKQGFFTNLVAAVSEPLQAVSGHLQGAIPALDADFKRTAGPDDAARKEIGERLAFALNETNRLNRFISEYRQIELFRQKLIKSTSSSAQLRDIIASVLEKELASYKRLPHLKISAALPADLPPVRADANLLRWAISGLIGYAAHGSGVGTINLTSQVDAARIVKLSITGTAFAAAGAPNEALLEDSRQFISRLAGPERPTDTSGSMMALVLSRMIAEYYGGRVDIAKGDGVEPGFALYLPAVA